jgi:tRNA (mo5U34)-methyltransferase
MIDLPTRQDDPRLHGWYHTIELGHGLVSKGVFDLRSVVDRYGIPASLRGKKCLEVGTGDGFFAFEMERRGAEKVVAIDLARLGDCDWVPDMKVRLAEAVDGDPWPLHFETAHAMRGSRVDYRFCSVYDLSPYTVGRFDVVFCGSLLLHLQNPLAALHAIRSVTRGIAIIETAVSAELEQKFPGEPLLRFGAVDEEKIPGEQNTFWVMTSAALEKMLRYAGFEEVHPQGTFLLPPHNVILASSMVARVPPRLGRAPDSSEIQ